MTAYQQARHEWVNPHTVIWANNPVNRDAVEHYKRHPNQPYRGALAGDGDPLIIRTPAGELVGCNGKHRAIAGDALAATGTTVARAEQHADAVIHQCRHPLPVLARQLHRHDRRGS